MGLKTKDPPSLVGIFSHKTWTGGEKTEQKEDKRTR